MHHNNNNNNNNNLHSRSNNTVVTSQRNLSVFALLTLCYSNDCLKLQNHFYFFFWS